MAYSVGDKACFQIFGQIIYHKQGGRPRVKIYKVAVGYLPGGVFRDSVFFFNIFVLLVAYCILAYNKLFSVKGSSSVNLFKTAAV